MKVINWVDHVVPSRGQSCREILLAFSIAVTTFTLCTRVESGKPSPTGWTQLSYTSRAYRMFDSSSVFRASFLFPLMCFWDLIWYSIEFFFMATTSLHPRQNNLLFLKMELFIWVCFEMFLRWDVLRITFLLALNLLDTFRRRVLLQLSLSVQIHRS